MLTSTHLLCGAGGDTKGWALAGFQPLLAANHSTRVIETHAANFPDTEHLVADVSNIDFRRLPRTNGLWASPVCTEISPAGGRRRSRNDAGQMALLEYGSVEEATWERTRTTAYEILRATEICRYDFVACENVIEFATDWRLFDWWIKAMEILEYEITMTCVSSAHIGGPDNPHAPQWRDRWYGVFTRRGIPKPDLEPRPLAPCTGCGEDVEAVQWWKDPRKPKIGKYRQQYLYRSPHAQCKRPVVEPYVRPAAAAIDWTNLGERIGDRARPLAANTIRRIEAGLRMFARPVPANSNHDDDRAVSGGAGLAPMPARTTKIGDGVAVPPMLVPSGGTWAETPMSALHEPMRTRTANPKGFEALVTAAEPFITVLRTNATTTGVDEPLRTIATGNHHYLTIPPGAFYVKNYGGHADPRRMAKPVTDPLGTVVASGAHHALVVPYYRTGKAKTAGDPFDTVTTNDRFALVSAEQIVQVDDCRYRMIQPRESLRGQAFPDDYIVTGNKGEQTAQAGNAVSVNVARWIGERIMAALDGRAVTGEAIEPAGAA